jgi:cytoskeletal protein RodZ
MPDETLGTRLRRERERRHIPLSSISENTKISVALFQGLERDDVSRWPSGIFRRAFIRSYAEAIGLDADAVAREFAERFPDPADAAPEPVEAAVAVKAHKPLPPRRPEKPALVTVTVRVPRWMTERLFTAVRPWSRA